jgi:4-aminobutyrate---pyruvate transaminase
MTAPAQANSLSSRDIAYHLHPQTNLKAHTERGPLILTSGKGVHVFDEDGKAYLDAMAGLWSASLGFSEPRLAKAAYDQMMRLPYATTFAHRSNPPVIALAEALLDIAPQGMEKVFFANSGSEAVDTAIKLVRYYWNAHGQPTKKKIIARANAYHGSTLASASLTGLERMQRDFDLPMAGVVRAPCPHFWKYGEDGETVEAFALRMAAELEAIILAEGSETIGAFIAEPVQGAGGVIVPPTQYFAHVQAVCRRHDVLFIADEVICGFGRTGHMWGSQLYDLAPDMVTSAKALSASYIPISALMVNARVFETMVSQSEKLGQFGHGFTYSGHPVAAAVALETLKIYEERDIVAMARANTPVLQAGLRDLASHPLVGEVRGVGMIAGVELARSKSGKEPFAPTAGAGPRVAAAAQERGLLVRALGDTIAFCPPLTITPEEIETIISRFADALDACCDELCTSGKNE